MLVMVVELEVAAGDWGHFCLTTVSAQGRADRGGAALIVVIFSGDVFNS